MAFTWAAVYQDGEIFHQFNPEDGSERSSERIDRKRLSSLVLYGHDAKVLFVQNLDPGHRLIYRRRMEAMPGDEVLTVHLIGWQKTVGGENVQHITYAYEKDNRIIMAGRWQDDHRWHYPIVPVPVEDIEVE